MSSPSRREVAVAGHTGDAGLARLGLARGDGVVRATALGALERLGELDDLTLSAHLGDPDPTVRRRAATIAATHPDVDLMPALDDDDPRVIEVATWACGEHEQVSASTLDRLIALAGSHDDALVRESAVAALGAIGDERAVTVIVAACDDKPAVRRRAMLALAPFAGDGRADVEAAIAKGLIDRNWQVRQAAEDIAGDGSEIRQAD